MGRANRGRLCCAASTRTTRSRAPSAELGLGMRSAVAVPSRDYRMDVARARARARSRSRATRRAGDGGRRDRGLIRRRARSMTSTRSARLCEERGIWLHIDGAHGATGAAVRASSPPRARHRACAVDRLGSAQDDAAAAPAGMLLVRDERELQAAFAQRAPYLFHGDERRRRAFEIRACAASSVHAAPTCSSCGWCSSARASRHRALCTITCATWRSQVREELAGHPEFEVLHAPESNILCFRYVGDGRASATRRCDAINREIRERYNRVGRGLDHGDDARRSTCPSCDDDEPAIDARPRSRARGRPPLRCQ